MTNDDAVQSVTFPVAYSQVVKQHKNPNGCPITAAWMVSSMWTNYHLLQQLYAEGMEIADHTMNHIGNPTEDEIEGMRIATQGLL